MNGTDTPAVMAGPLPMVHQPDLNFLFRQMQELGEILRANRDKVNGIGVTAEEVMVSLLFLVGASLTIRHDQSPKK